LRPGWCLLSLDIFGNAGRLRDRNSIGLQGFDMETNRFADFTFDGGDGIAARPAPFRIPSCPRRQKIAPTATFSI
jgi:hypothetical protein